MTGEQVKKAATVDASGGTSGDSALANGDSARNGRDMGTVLRTVYDETLNETVPPEMLALLGKLG